MSRDRAAYMRDYRKRQRRDHDVLDDAAAELVRLHAENDLLTAEVAQLRQVMAALHVKPRPVEAAMREFRPAPKPGKRR